MGNAVVFIGVQCAKNRFQDRNHAEELIKPSVSQLIDPINKSCIYANRTGGHPIQFQNHEIIEPHLNDKSEDRCITVAW